MLVMTRLFGCVRTPIALFLVMSLLTGVTSALEGTG